MTTKTANVTPLRRLQLSESLEGRFLRVTAGLGLLVQPSSPSTSASVDAETLLATFWNRGSLGGGCWIPALARNE